MATTESELKSAFTEVGTKIKGLSTRMAAAEVTAAHNVVGTLKGVFVAPNDPVPVGMPAWGLVIGEQV